jgi:hypothetical protein
MPKKLRFLVYGERADFLVIFKKVHLHFVTRNFYRPRHVLLRHDPYDIGKRKGSD